MIELVGKYTTAKIFAETIEEGVYSQVYDIINCRAFEGQKVVCMPDVHVGASGPFVAEYNDTLTNIDALGNCLAGSFSYDIDELKPYLRLMSSMTKEEIKEYKHLVAFSGNPNGTANFIDWLNKNHFDYRGLIPMGLAIEVTKENNPYEKINL